jgi:hypothetical protein
MTRVLFLAVLASGTTIHAAAAAMCEYANHRNKVFLSGRCSVPSASLTKTVVINKTKVKVEFVDHLGEYHRWKINGKNASAYEFHREAYCGWTDDLSEHICFAYRGRPPW